MRAQGKYCKRGHDVSVTGCYGNNTCKECSKANVQLRRALYGRPPRSAREKERQVEYYYENLDRVRAHKRTDYRRHRSKRLAAVKAFNATTRGKEVHNKANAQYRDTHREEIKKAGRLRAYRTPPEVLDAIVEYYGPECVYCGGDASGFDHLIPMVKGGETSFENLAPCCWDCNRRKGDRPIWTVLSLEGGDALRAS